jgi:hypothetical protein
MAFQVRCDFTPVYSYAHAAVAWQTGVIFRRNRNGPRGLISTRKKHMTIEKTPAEDFILRLYKHPVVTWHKDNSFTLSLISTRSTMLFASHCMPPSIYASICGGYASVTINGRTYKVGIATTFQQRDGTWKADRIEPWSIPFVNRERARQVLRETGYNEFRTWLSVYVQMAAKPDGFRKYFDDGTIVDMLRNRAWRELIVHFPGAWSSCDQVLGDLRQAIYRHYDCIERKSVEFLGRGY